MSAYSVYPAPSHSVDDFRRSPAASGEPRDAPSGPVRNRAILQKREAAQPASLSRHGRHANHAGWHCLLRMYMLTSIRDMLHASFRLITIIVAPYAVNVKQFTLF